MPLRNKRDKRLECQNRISTTEQYGFEVESRTCAVNDSMKESHRPKPFSISKDTIVRQPQSNAFVLPAHSATCQKLLFDNEERRDDGSKSVTLSRVLKNSVTSPVTGINLESDKDMITPKYTTAQDLEFNPCQKSDRKQASPEQEFRKAIIFIFLSLFICYFPTLFSFMNLQLL